MAHYLIAVGTVLLVLVGWVAVQHIARLYARDHPQFGPYREEGGGCGSSCRCDRAEQHCPHKQLPS
ncbi:MAG: hypothetical protein AMS22_01890 [Thiotrichales bacterium SG8_50]|nr:MAG: hypothetical protein AMS22_01890 [Thiotrichales bacterium SG8_50]